ALPAFWSAPEEKKLTKSNRGLKPAFGFRVLMLSVIALLAFGSGVAALIYEIVWFQLLELIIGSSAVSLAVLLATFMGGTCLGSVFLSRLIPIRHNPLRIYAFIELGIAILAVLLLLVTSVAALPGLLLRALVTAGCLLPPTFLMGATLPMLS